MIVVIAELEIVDKLHGASHIGIETTDEMERSQLGSIVDVRSSGKVKPCAILGRRFRGNVGTFGSASSAHHRFLARLFAALGSASLAGKGAPQASIHWHGED
jgi:hypothetical protein